jgi:hypothetical protein
MQMKILSRLVFLLTLLPSYRSTIHLIVKFDKVDKPESRNFHTLANPKRQNPIVITFPLSISNSAQNPFPQKL